MLDNAYNLIDMIVLVLQALNFGNTELQTDIHKGYIPYMKCTSPLFSMYIIDGTYYYHAENIYYLHIKYWSNTLNTHIDKRSSKY